MAGATNADNLGVINLIYGAECHVIVAVFADI
jgi:hypothetical protein